MPAASCQNRCFDTVISLGPHLLRHDHQRAAQESGQQRGIKPACHLQDFNSVPFESTRLLKGTFKPKPSSLKHPESVRTQGHIPASSWPRPPQAPPPDSQEAGFGFCCKCWALGKGGRVFRVRLRGAWYCLQDDLPELDKLYGVYTWQCSAQKGEALKVAPAGLAASRWQLLVELVE